MGLHAGIKASQSLTDIFKKIQKDKSSTLTAITVILNFEKTEFVEAGIFRQDFSSNDDENKKFEHAVSEIVSISQIQFLIYKYKSDKWLLILYLPDPPEGTAQCWPCSGFTGNRNRTGT